MRTETPPTIHLKDYTPSSHVIDHVSLDVSLDATATRVVATSQVRPNPAAKAGARTLQLDGEGLELKRIAINGEEIGGNRYRIDGEKMVIDNVPAEPFELTVETICNPQSNTALSGLYRSNGIFCTQCEAEGFRRITWFLDRPDVMATYDVRIEADKASCPVLLSNGNPVEHGDLPDGRHFAIWHDPWPKPSYLFALVGGDLACVSDSFTTMSGREVDLRIYVEQGKQDRCDWAMQSLKASMKWDEEAFGREYDLDIFMIVAVSDFNMGAMENKGLNVFNDKYILARPDTATDQDYVHIEAIIAHEYFHNWTGNRITCRDWFQLCLKEGLTVFRDQEFSSDMRSRAVKRIADVIRLRSEQFPEDEQTGWNWRGSGRVLVIDDEETVRTVAARILEALGFSTVVAANGEEGLNLFREHADDYRMILSDVSMPVMDGAETCARIRNIRHDIPIVLMSGYWEEQAKQKFETHVSGFLKKPFSPEQLRDTMKLAFADFPGSIGESELRP